MKKIFQITLVLVLLTVSFLPIQPAQAASNDYECKFVKQTPADFTVFKPKQDFDMYWTLKNTGSETWTDLNVVFLTGKPIHKYPAPFSLSSTTAPGQTLKVGVDMVVPKTPGTYKTVWSLKSDTGVVFCKFYLYFIVK